MKINEQESETSLFYQADIKEEALANFFPLAIW